MALGQLTIIMVIANSKIPKGRPREGGPGYSGDCQAVYHPHQGQDHQDASVGPGGIPHY